MGFSASNIGSLSLIGQAGGAITSAIGSKFEAASKKSSLNAQAGLANTSARIAETNARIAELGAQTALQQGESQVAKLTLQAGNLKASQRTTMAANGIDIGQGSAAELQASTDIMKEIDANTLTANAIRHAFGYQTQATNARTQGVNARNAALAQQAAASGISPGMAGATSLLGSATKVAASWYGMNKAGVFDKPPKVDDEDIGMSY
ncbi:MAG TPA: hypothetical protein PK752_03165 [Accumulibacter sp.]|jgi:hypothetical protein|uniref:hypothetical protein n=1 Tax=Accumulibacter sp. TaxID=2053492 RepID=UPI002C6DCABD|nr:hypothetical protein [Accumulibacter sp.]HRD87248.1 hypothetical protein [Accumulibacter sp.]